MAAHEPLNLITFLKENASDISPEQIDNGIKPIIEHLILSAPNRSSTLSNHPNFSTQYKQLQEESKEHNIDCLAAAICQKILHIAPATTLYNKAILKFILLDGSNIIDAQNASLFTLLYTHSTFFSLIAVGNSAHRASYAALELKSCLGDDFNIHIKNIPGYEHYVIYISKPGVNKFYIYDPLLNPELIFTVENYKEITTLYQKDPQRWAKTPLPTPLHIKITSDIVNLYRQFTIKMQALMLTEINSKLEFSYCYEELDLKSSLPKMKANAYKRRLQESIVFLQEKISDFFTPEENLESSSSPKNGFIFWDSWNGVPKSTPCAVTADSTERPTPP